MNLRDLVLAAAGLGSAALVGCGGPTLQVEPAAATAAATAAPAETAAPEPQATASPEPAGQRTADGCDAGPWTGTISPEGRPAGLDPGDAGAVYIWHDGAGWHVRSTDRRPVDHHYTGTIRLTPPGARFVAIRTVRDERHDRVLVDGANVLRYDFHTFASVDGVDFRVSCPPDRREHERLAFHTEFDGHAIADRVKIGADRRSPATADFAFVRSV